ncbi:DegT/DnrJ/EryC1/StrS family aminotransferase [Candidatus Planktophila vernalis]|uniref:DegT/DnrJ/EryC1/StrS family aminotransferase n=1 Tax=Candidatus Planktophila vernalis TaxID=1884907 RepID=UPI001681B7AB|nr:DegT/DnrJ/EryC1/StrS family aminotransferase [Candidatus Planktophila vernalis]
MNKSVPGFQVSFYDSSRKIAKYRSEINEAVERVFNSGNLVLGSEVASFEKEFANFLGAKYCVGTANGTDSLEIALIAVGAGLGSKVATCANAGGYSSTAISCIGATPMFMDVELESRNITIESVKYAIKQGAQYVIATHLYGMAIRDIDQISILCKDNNVILIEDCAQAHGAEISGKKVGTFGSISTFSFYPTKNLGGLGDGGALITDDDELFVKLLKLRTYGWGEKYRVEIARGRNSRLDEVQAAILRVFLRHLTLDNEKRLQIAQFYNEQIQSVEILKPQWKEGQFVAHIYAVASSSRNSILEKLSHAGVGYAIHYPITDHHQIISNNKDLSLMNSELLSNSIFSLPCYPELTHEEMCVVVEAINSK